MEFRAMRRSRQALAPQACAEILEKGTSGVLAVLGDGGYPYAVPLSYVFAGDALYFHSARTGHKLDAAARCARASFCVIGQDEIVPEKFTTCYRSAIAFGTLHIVEAPSERRAAMELLMQKYSPAESAAAREAEYAATEKALCVWKLTIEHLTGKEAIELLRRREAAAAT